MEGVGEGRIVYGNVGVERIVYGRCRSSKGSIWKV